MSLESLRMGESLFRSQSCKLASQQPRLSPWPNLRKIEWNPGRFESAPELRYLVAFACMPVIWELAVYVGAEEASSVFLQMLMHPPVYY